MCVCVRACACVCVRERERESGCVCVCLCVYRFTHPLGFLPWPCASQPPDVAPGPTRAMSVKEEDTCMSYEEEVTCLALFRVPQEFAFVLLPHTLDHYRVDRRQRPFLLLLSYYIYIYIYKSTLVLWILFYLSIYLLVLNFFYRVHRRPTTCQHWCCEIYFIFYLI